MPYNLTPSPHPFTDTVCLHNKQSHTPCPPCQACRLRHPCLVLRRWESRDRRGQLCDKNVALQHMHIQGHAFATADCLHCHQALWQGMAARSLPPTLTPHAAWPHREGRRLAVIDYNSITHPSALLRHSSIPTHSLPTLLYHHTLDTGRQGIARCCFLGVPLD